MNTAELRIPREMVLARKWMAETARMENTVSGVCPLCKDRMQVKEANNLPVYSCLPCRIIMPFPD
jgi:hypothetical protein